MRTSNELYKAHRAIIDECKANICRELERIGRPKLYFDTPFFIAVANYGDNLKKEEIASLSITESGEVSYLWDEGEYVIDPIDVIPSEWLHIWAQVEEECKAIPTAYYTEIAHHDKKNNRLIYDLDDIEETKIEGEQQAKEQLIYNYRQYVTDFPPVDYLPVFFLCVRENGQYRRKYAILSGSVAEEMKYTQTELQSLRKSLNYPVICA